jgi:hypothetical protein
MEGGAAEESLTFVNVNNQLHVAAMQRLGASVIVNAN